MRARIAALPVAMVMVGLAFQCMAQDQVVADIKFDVMTLGVGAIESVHWEVFQMELQPNGCVSGWPYIMQNQTGTYQLTMLGPRLATVSIDMLRQGGWGGYTVYSQDIAWFEDGKWRMVGYGIDFFLSRYGSDPIRAYILVGVESLQQ